jgi:hypothetical protein
LRKNSNFSYAKLADRNVPFALLANKNIILLSSITAKLPDLRELVYAKFELLITLYPVEYTCPLLLTQNVVFKVEPLP